MLNVSPAWQAASRDQFRYQAYLYFNLSLTPAGMREGVTVSAVDKSVHSINYSLVDNITDQPTRYATLEPNRWRLDGKWSVIPTDTHIVDDWWTKSIYLEDFDTLIEFTFDKEYSIPGTYIIWDAESETYPESVTLKGYNLSGQLIAQHTFSISSYEGFLDFELIDVAKIDLIMHRWSRSNWRKRILEVQFGLNVKFDSVNNGRISKAEFSDKSSMLADELPTHSATLTLRNIDGYFDPKGQTGITQFLSEKQIAKLRWGFYTSSGTLEYSPNMFYVVNSLKVPDNSKDVTLALTNRLDLLSNMLYNGTWESRQRTFAEIATFVLQNGGVLREFDTETPWTLHNALSQFTTSAPIPAKNAKELLQLVASATCTMLHVNSETGFIEFIQPSIGASEYCAIGTDQELGDPEISVFDKVHTITVAQYSYTQDTEYKQLGSHTYQIDGVQVLQLKYSTEYAVEVSATVDGATVVSQDFYSSYCEIVVSTESEVEVKIELGGYELLKTVTNVVTYTNANVTHGIDVVYDNPFVTETANLEAISDYLLDYYEHRNTYKAKYTGYPQLESGDKILMTSVYGSEDTVVVGSDISFNGGWTGTAQLKGC